ncbi:hypothetical protein AB0M43_23835 [Longispora sp. NPDC051575]|uniref:hypothetical protein n=1 Tax=Longispora sp. NPDC051575 TaxID=3154943 RepID=UPI003417CEE7
MPDLLVTLSVSGGVSAPPVVNDAVSEVRRALMDRPGMSAFTDDGGSWLDAAERLRRDVPVAWKVWLTAPRERFSRTIARMPGLIRGAMASSQVEEAHATALDGWHLVRSVLSRVGEAELAWLVADRSMGLAESTGDRALIAASAWHLAGSYLRRGHNWESQRFAVAAARRLAQGSGPPEDRALVVLWGALHALAAEACAAAAEARVAAELLATARTAAERIGGDAWQMFIPFGVTEYSIARVHVAIRLGGLSEALRLAADVDIADDYPVERQVRYYFPLAHAHFRRGDDVAAVFTLTKAAALSEEDLRYDWMARRCLDGLSRRGNRSVRRELNMLLQLADRVSGNVS